MIYNFLCRNLEDPRLTVWKKTRCVPYSVVGMTWKSILKISLILPFITLNLSKTVICPRDVRVITFAKIYTNFSFITIWCCSINLLLIKTTIQGKGKAQEVLDEIAKKRIGETKTKVIIGAIILVVLVAVIAVISVVTSKGSASDLGTW